MRNIVIVGFMGTGKTIIAKLLSQKHNVKYVSTDDFIEKKEKMPITEIFSKKGERHFRNIEKTVVADVSQMDDVVIDAGGGVVIDGENIKNLKKKGFIVCLWAEPGDILSRTKKYTTRPLLNVDDPLKKIKELLDFRKPFYERADYHINTSKLSTEEVMETIERIIKDESQKR